jgi:plastocyanin
MRTKKACMSFLAFPLLLAAGAARAEEQTIAISDFAFSPPELSVSLGTTVTWVNHDEEPHRVVESAGTFRSPALDTDGRYSVTFAKPGR